MVQKIIDFLEIHTILPVDFPPSDVPRRETPSSELGGKSIESGSTGKTFGGFKVEGAPKSSSLDIRIMVTKDASTEMKFILVKCFGL